VGGGGLENDYVEIREVGGRVTSEMGLGETGCENGRWKELRIVSDY
jgi:hypothetical protein